VGDIVTKQFQVMTDVDRVWDFMTQIYVDDRSNGVPAPFVTVQS